MNLPDPEQQHRDNMTLFTFTLLTIVIYLAGCGLLGALVYTVN